MATTSSHLDPATGEELYLAALDAKGLKVRKLLASGMTPNFRHVSGDNALSTMAGIGDAKTCAALLIAGADPFLGFRPAGADSPISRFCRGDARQISVACGQFRVIALLVAMEVHFDGVNLGSTDPTDPIRQILAMGPLQAAVYAHSPEMIDRCLSQQGGGQIRPIDLDRAIRQSSTMGLHETAHRLRAFAAEMSARRAVQEISKEMRMSFPGSA